MTANGVGRAAAIIDSGSFCIANGPQRDGARPEAELLINKVGWSDSRFWRDGSFNARSLRHAVTVLDDPRDSLRLNTIVPRPSSGLMG
jgi:hypothetical protein